MAPTRHATETESESATISFAGSRFGPADDGSQCVGLEGVATGKKTDFDYVVIGSGFGGSVAALRLSEAGQSVLVLERGRRYSPGDFPRDITDTDRVFWRFPNRPTSLGLYDVRFFAGLGAVVASGVGGGSLVYANIHIRPDPVVFEDVRWPAGINRVSLDPHYDRVAAMLGVSPLPAARRLPKRDRFREAAAASGRTVFDPDQAVSWSDPQEPGRRACEYRAECEFGCPIGAKNTLDVTYLLHAERRGARVVPLAHVDAIEPVEHGWRISYRDLSTTGHRANVTGRRAVIAAGTLGTNELLLRCRDELRTLPNVSPRLGYGYSGNGDFLGSIQGARFDLEPWNGTDVTSVIRYFDTEPSFTMAAPTFNRGVMQFLAAMGQRDVGWLRWAAPLIWRSMPWLVPLVCRSGLLGWIGRRGARNPDAAAHMTNLFAIGRDNAGGQLLLRRGQLEIDWDYARQNQALLAQMQTAMEEVATFYGGRFAPLFSWSLFSRILTVHSLGGCHLSDAPDRGVVSPRGAVHGHPGLYVADGSVIPTAIGFHPCMTIAAVAEHIVEGLAREQ
jgi:cholesterol oxidase